MLTRTLNPAPITGSALSDPTHRGFLSVLAAMTPEERISASRHGGFTRAERTIWAARFPEEVPLINGEFEWIALAGADLNGR